MNSFNSAMIKLYGIDKTAAPDFINKLLGRPTNAQVRRLAMLKKVLPIAGTLGLSALGFDAISKAEKEVGNDPEALRSLMNKRRIHDIVQGAALALAMMPGGLGTDLYAGNG